VLVGIDHVHEESGEYFDDQELKDVLLTPIGKIFSLFPVGELVGLLAVSKWPEMVDFFFMLNHDGVDLSVFHHILPKMIFTF
jgi:hypothetical protein